MANNKEKEVVETYNNDYLRHLFDSLHDILNDFKRASYRNDFEIIRKGICQNRNTLNITAEKSLTRVEDVFKELYGVYDVARREYHKEQNILGLKSHPIRLGILEEIKQLINNNEDPIKNLKALMVLRKRWNKAGPFAEGTFKELNGTYESYVEQIFASIPQYILDDLRESSSRKKKKRVTKKHHTKLYAIHFIEWNGEKKIYTTSASSKEEAEENFWNSGVQFGANIEKIV